jgi:hypothetical protein
MSFQEGPVDLEAMQRAPKAAPPAANLMIPRPHRRPQGSW